jgi:hypothetical protein
MVSCVECLSGAWRSFRPRCAIASRDQKGTQHPKQPSGSALTGGKEEEEAEAQSCAAIRRKQLQSGGDVRPGKVIDDSILFY